MAKKLALCYLGFYALLLAVSLFFDKAFFLSSQVGFFGAVLILVVSFFSYKRQVNKKLNDKNLQIQKEQKDIENEEFIDLKTEKARLKAKKLKLKDMNLSTAFVPYRLIAYTFLVAGFFTLRHYGMFSVTGFLLGISLMPIGAFVFGVLQNGK